MIRSNSTERPEAEGGIACGHRAAVFAGALVASAGCFAVVPGDTLVGSLVQTALLAVIVLVAVGVSHPSVLGVPTRGTGCGARGEAACGPRRAAGRRAIPWVVYVLVVGLVAGIATLAALLAGGALPGAAMPADAPAASLPRIAQVVVLCLLTGVFEEGVFRVLAIDALAPALGDGRRGLMRAALVSAALFGLLHVSTGDAASAPSATAWAQLALKPVQAGLFGFFMAALYVRTRNLWTIAGVHGAFNLLYLGPLMLAGGMQQTYATGNPVDLAVLAATTVLLVPTAVFACKALREG